MGVGSRDQRKTNEFLDSVVKKTGCENQAFKQICDTVVIVYMRWAYSFILLPFLTTTGTTQILQIPICGVPGDENEEKI